MEDRFGRKKWAFWLFVCALAAVTVVPSAVLLHALDSYWQFLTGAAPATIRPVQVNFLDRRNEARAPEEDLRFVEFRLKAGKAKSVELVGDFNGWKPGSLPLARAGGGAWELLLPLRPGAYRYQFLVDGQAQAAPRAPASVGPDGRPASLRTVR